MAEEVFHPRDGSESDQVFLPTPSCGSGPVQSSSGFRADFTDIVGDGLVKGDRK